MKFTRLPGKASWWIKSFSDWLHWMLYCEKSWKREMAAMDFGMWKASRSTLVAAEAANDVPLRLKTKGDH